MVYNSLIISFLYSVCRKVKDIYYHGLIASVLKALTAGLKKLFADSSIWSFVKRKDFFSKTWEHSLLFRLLDGAVNLPLRLLGAAYGKLEGIFEESLSFRLLKSLLARFEVVLGLLLVIAIVAKHEWWNNLYNTLIVLFLALLYLVKTAIRRDEAFASGNLDFAFVVFFLVAALSMVTSVFPGSGVRFLVFYLTCFLLVLVIVSSIRSIKQLNLLIEILLVGVTLTGLYGLWQVHTGVPVDPSLTDVTLNEGMFGRIFSTMHNPNNYAEFLILTIPFYGAVVLNAGSWVKRLLFAALAVPPVVALLFTGARAGYIALALAVFVFLFFKNRKLIPVAILLGILLLPFLPQSIYKRMLTIVNPRDSSASYRILIYKTIWPMFKDFWKTGIGLGTDAFMQICQRYYQHTWKIPPHSHNLFVQIWIEMGLAGIISFLWFLGRTVKKCALNIFGNTDRETNHILMAGMAALAGVLLMGLVEHVWFYPRVMLFFWVVIGIIFAGLGILSRCENQRG